MIIGCDWTDQIGSEMDRLAKAYEKYGTISISEPILVEAKADANSYFAFDLPAGPNDYYKAARGEVQGRAAAFRQTVERSGLGVKASDDTSSLPAGPQGTADPNSTQAENELIKDALAGLLEGSPGMKVANRSAIITAAGDTVTEAIFKLLGNPARAMQFEDKLIMFGVSMVTVNPGWLTRKDYTTELAVSCSYEYDVARRELLLRILEKLEAEKGVNDKTQRGRDNKKLVELIKYVLEGKEVKYGLKDDFVPQRFQKGFREEFTPLCAAASPMTDVDALDLSSRRSEQVSNALSMAGALSRANMKAQAEFFRQWAKRTEQDVRIISAYAAVTAYSNGGFFGFRVRPRLKAIENPSLFGSKSAYVLEPQAFPVVIIVGMDRDDLKLGFEVRKDSEGVLRLVALEPTLAFRQTANWLPNNSSRSRVDEAQRLRWARSYIKAYDILYDKEYEIGDEKIYEFIRNRIDLLSYSMLDTWTSQYIPVELIIKQY
jgi:hypothetical protein